MWRMQSVRGLFHNWLKKPLVQCPVTVVLARLLKKAVDRYSWNLERYRTHLLMEQSKNSHVDWIESKYASGSRTANSVIILCARCSIAVVRIPKCFLAGHLIMYARRCEMFVYLGLVCPCSTCWVVKTTGTHGRMIVVPTIYARAAMTQNRKHRWQQGMSHCLTVLELLRIGMGIPKPNMNFFKDDLKCLYVPDTILLLIQ